MKNNNVSYKEKYKCEATLKPFEYSMALIGGKWKLNILFWLSKKKVIRYNELKRLLEGITHKMLSNKLKELESDNLIIRKEYPQVPPKVEYFLSERGESLMPILNELCKWGMLHIND